MTQELFILLNSKKTKDIDSLVFKFPSHLKEVLTQSILALEWYKTYCHIKLYGVDDPGSKTVLQLTFAHFVLKLV